MDRNVHRSIVLIVGILVFDPAAGAKVTADSSLCEDLETPFRVVKVQASNHQVGFTVVCLQVAFTVPTQAVGVEEL